MSEDVEYYHTTNHYNDTATFLKICNDITVLLGEVAKSADNLALDPVTYQLNSGRDS